MRPVWLLALVALSGCLGCEGTRASWIDGSAPSFLRSVLGDPEVHPYQQDFGFGGYVVPDAVLLSVSTTSAFNIALHNGSIGYWLREADDRGALRENLSAVGRAVYQGDMAEFEEAIEASIAQVDEARASQPSADLPHYTFMQQASLEGAWDLDAMWATTNGTQRTQTFGYGFVAGEWSFRYRLAEWRVDLDGMAVGFDAWGQAEASHRRNLHSEEVQQRVRDWFSGHGGEAGFTDLSVSHLQC